MKPRKQKTNNNAIKLYFFFTWILLLVYLFVNAPPPLPTGDQESPGKQISSYQLFELVQHENAVVRKLWTQKIVGAGKKLGLKFSEDWEEPDVEAGPLPALFLRATASRLEKNKVPLSLFLGSDAPINQANEFDARQTEKFQKIKQDQQPQLFYSEDIERYTGMFPDIASVEACVKCHNDHKESPKKDWKILDVMGATTWLYPKAQLSLEEALEVIKVLRAQFRAVYESYLKKAEAFSKPPQVGEKWPDEGSYLPSSDVFMAVFEKEASNYTMNRLFEMLGQDG